MKYKLICIDCGKEYKPDEAEYVCPACSKNQKSKQPTLGILRAEYNYDKDLRNKFLKTLIQEGGVRGQERFIDLLPLNSIDSLPPFQIGPTPLRPVQRVREKYGLENLYIKDDTGLPTASFKDRASSIVVAKARELNKKIVTTASTGNAATALAGMCASVGMKNVIFVPESSPKAKLTQIAMFGAELIPVKGAYDDAFELSKEATKRFGWYNRNTGFNPYTIEGKKTAALEIWEQLGYKPPDKVLIPTGDGVILAGTYVGFYNLKKLGLIKKIPEMIPVQAEGCAPTVDALDNNSESVTPIKKADTCADSIACAVPVLGNWNLKIVRETGGFGIKVSDEEILSSMKELASLTGVFAEPAAAAAYAGLIKGTKENKFSKDETIVVLITGSGLKDIDSAMKAIKIPQAIPPKIEMLKDI